MVRAFVVDGPRGGFQPAVCLVIHVFSFDPLAMCCWLHKVWQIVREVSADGLLRADGPRVGLGRSIFQGAVLEVREAISDGSQ
jgi:hypothetical protein